MAVFDQALGRRIEKIIDCSGKERFPSVYSYIYTWKQPYEVITLEKDGKSVIPAAYKHIGWCGDRKHFFCCSDGCCEMYLMETK